MRSSEHQTALLGIALVAPRAELDVPPPNSRGAFVNCHLCGIDWELSRAHTASLVLLVGVIATAVAFAVPLIDLLIDLSEWLIGYSFLTVFTVFTGTIVILTPLGAPFTAFAVLAGFMFRKKLESLLGGVAVAVASMTLGYGGGSIVGFLIGRMLLRECAEGIAKQNKASPLRRSDVTTAQPTSSCTLPRASTAQSPPSGLTRFCKPSTALSAARRGFASTSCSASRPSCPTR